MGTPQHALARDHPLRAVRHHVVDALLAPRRDPADLVADGVGAPSAGARSRPDAMNHCSVARNSVGFLHRQQCGYVWLSVTSATSAPAARRCSMICGLRLPHRLPREVRDLGDEAPVVVDRVVDLEPERPARARSPLPRGRARCGPGRCPQSIATKSAASTGESRSIHGWRHYRARRSSAPGRASERQRGGGPRRRSRRRTASASGAATTSALAVNLERGVGLARGAPRWRGWRAGSTGSWSRSRADGLAPPSADAGEARRLHAGTSRRPTGVVWSSYSTSAWASAVLQCMHQCTGLRPL